jgi:alpha-tubulin suppressor-like RCC1 family protein
VSGGHTFSASFVFACGLDQDRQAWCWGTNDNGQLGDGTGTNSSIPVAVAGS